MLSLGRKRSRGSQVESRIGTSKEKDGPECWIYWFPGLKLGLL
jgi:hypothetical protein